MTSLGNLPNSIWALCRAQFGPWLHSHRVSRRLTAAHNFKRSVRGNLGDWRKRARGSEAYEPVRVQPQGAIGPDTKDFQPFPEIWNRIPLTRPDFRRCSAPLGIQHQRTAPPGPFLPVPHRQSPTACHRCCRSTRQMFNGCYVTAVALTNGRAKTTSSRGDLTFARRCTKNELTAGRQGASNSTRL